MEWGKGFEVLDLPELPLVNRPTHAKLHLHERVEQQVEQPGAGAVGDDVVNDGAPAIFSN